MKSCAVPAKDCIVHRLPVATPTQYPQDISLARLANTTDETISLGCQIRVILLHFVTVFLLRVSFERNTYKKSNAMGYIHKYIHMHCCCHFSWFSHGFVLQILLRQANCKRSSQVHQQSKCVQCRLFQRLSICGGSSEYEQMQSHSLSIWSKVGNKWSLAIFTTPTSLVCYCHHLESRIKTPKLRDPTKSLFSIPCDRTSVVAVNIQ